MKIAVLNYSGNVGKTTISKNLLLPRLPETPYLAIETINDNGVAEEDMMVKGKNYRTVANELLINDNLLVDMGSSNIEQSLEIMKTEKNSHEDYDYFIIPVIPDVKEQIDTNSTILKLIELGVKPNKIRIVFNKVDEIDEINSDFAKVISFIQNYKIRIPKTGIEINDVYSELRSMDMTIEGILAKEGLREKIKEAKDMEEKRRLALEVSIQRMAMTAKENLDLVFKDLSLT